MPTTTQQEIDMALHVAILHGGGSPEVMLELATLVRFVQVFWGPPALQ